MQEILKKLWCGEIKPKEDVVYNSSNEEVVRLSSLIDVLHMEFSSMIDDELFQKFNQYEEAHGELAKLIAEDAFAEGFSLALGLVIGGMGKS